MTTKKPGSGIKFVFTEGSVPPSQGEAPPAVEQPARAPSTRSDRGLSGVGAISALVEGARGPQRGSAIALDPADIDLTEFADRDESSFRSTEFEELKDSIRLAGGNYQPIKVRIAPTRGEGGKVRYQLIFGSRRLRACREVNVKVNAIVEPVDSDRQLYLQMVGENRGRAGLSPWEQGRSYHHALRRGLFKTQSELATATGLDQSNVSKAMRIAELPDELISLFASPTEVTFRAGIQLADALKDRHQAVLTNAAALRGRGVSDPQAIVRALLEVPKKAGARRSKTALKLPGAKPGRVESAPDGSVRVELPKGSVRADRVPAFVAALERLMSDFSAE
jgi:ParB family chromosome partitioning protein